MRQLLKDSVFPSRVGLHILWLIILSVICSQGLWMLSQKSDGLVTLGIVELFVVAVGTIVTIQSLFRLVKAHLK